MSYDIVFKSHDKAPMSYDKVFKSYDTVFKSYDIAPVSYDMVFMSYDIASMSYVKAVISQAKVVAAGFRKGGQLVRSVIVGVLFPGGYEGVTVTITLSFSELVDRVGEIDRMIQL